MKVEMKDSGIPWVGEIPKIWSVVQLSSIFKEHKDKNKLLEENNLLSLSYGRIIRKDINTKEGLLPQSFDGYNIIQEGDIVFRLTDLQNDKRSLRTGLCKEKGIITSAYITIRKTQELHSEFFHYLLHSYDECKVFYGLGDGVRQGMSFDDLRKLLLVVPPFHIQQQIAKFLDDKCADIDQLIALQQQMIDELKAYKQSVITEAVCKGLDKSAPMKDSGIEWIGKVPEGWEVIRLDKIGNFNKGLTITKENLQEEGIPCVNYGEIHSKFGFEVDPNVNVLKCVAEDYITMSPNSILKYGDFVFADTSEDIDGSGNFTYLNSDVQTFAGYHTIIFRTRAENVVSRYLAYLFCSKSYRAQIQCKVKGVKVFSISQGILKSTYVLLPKIEEQKAIVSYLDQKSSQIDTLISIKQQKIDELKEYKKSMIYEYITGKKQVPNE